MFIRWIEILMHMEMFKDGFSEQKMILLHQILWPHFVSALAKETVYPPPSQL